MFRIFYSTAHFVFFSTMYVWYNTLSVSEVGKEFLNDSVMLAALTVIAASVNSTPEEYLSRFETALSEKEKGLFEIFESI